MHKTVLKFAINKAFALLDIAIDLVRAAYSDASKAGSGVLGQVDKTAEDLKAALNKAVDEL